MRPVSVRSSATPPSSSRMVIHPAAIRNMRRASEPVRGVSSASSVAATGSATSRFGGVVQTVAETADGGDDLCAQLFANARYENLDRVRIAVKVLIVDMLDQFGAADDLPL